MKGWIRAARAYGDVVAASLEKWAAELRESAAKVEQSAYWRGYSDGVRDGRAVAAVGRADEASGSRQPYPNE